ncbi:Chorismate mutase I / Prephenate dehydratase [hydrothermal vent metagenome]|uniref:Bifunctional chorismate mutase/prephenate dehydratase n=1 Tax=hydrothermal vent metagenome TaxID=652676 RepID=A0A3B0Y4K2_9ZZZZ
MPNEITLDDLRQKIDALDKQLQDMLNMRARYAQQVAEIKREVEDDPEFYRPEREAAVLQRVQERNKGPLSNEEVTRLFREVMSACLALEQVLKVAYLGPEGTFTQAAALKHFGHSVNVMSMSSINEIFREVESGACHYGVVPVENSTEGVINHTLDMFMNSPLQICGEVELRIHHNLMSIAPMDDIKRVYSHSQSLAQCRGWLDSHLPAVDRISVSSNAEAARLAHQSNEAAAIAGESAADIYQLNYLAKNIEDDPDNTTRFLIVGRHPVSSNGIDKTSLLVSAGNKVGTLHRLLQPFVKHEISMTRIESRPSRRGMWDYVFFIDINGHIEDEVIKTAIEELNNEAMSVKVLGSYPRAVL